MAEVPTGAVANEVCVVCRGAVRHGPCASSEGVVQTLGNVLKCVDNGVTSSERSHAENFVMHDDVVRRPGVPLNSSVRLYMSMSEILHQQKQHDKDNRLHLRM